MTKRRSLAEGLKSNPKVDPKKEAAFVYQSQKAKDDRANPQKPTPPPVEDASPPAPPTRPEPPPAPIRGGRVPLTTRLRGDIGAALKRASLERQLAGLEPSAVQDILDVALEPWLRAHGYLK